MNTKSSILLKLAFSQLQSIKIASVLFLGIFLLLFSTGCNRDKVKSLKSQQTLDSTFIFSYMKAEPKFASELNWGKKFYRERKFQLGWFKDNKLVPQAKEMLSVIAKADEDALDPKDYQIKDFVKLFADLENARKDIARYSKLQGEIDVALSSTYFLWASDFYRGKVTPVENEQLLWDVKKNKIKLHKALSAVLQHRKSKYDYADFEPLHQEYRNLKIALANYRRIKAAGGWPKIPQETKLKPGQNSAGVTLLRKRLGKISTVTDTANQQVYETSLVDAVKLFQKNQGLKPDGVVGGETLRLLNIPVEKQINAIILNMERWRWVPKSFEQDYLIVNIPEYRLRVFEKGQQKITMKVIVGKTLNSTPIFSDKMEYIVLSPYWNVPMSIIKKELAPKLINNPNYLERLDMEIVTNKLKVVSATSIDWASVNESNFKYIVRRRPGPKNDLGDVKFIFPNNNDIYLHDTPNDQLFNETKRGFSHGCVRVEKPVDLAVYLLRNVPGYNRSKIQSLIAERKEKHVSLKKVIPVYLVYFTAWADEKGSVSFREDIYGHDKTLAAEYFN